MPIDEKQLLKKSISNIDLFFIVKELNDILEAGFITNIYNLPDVNNILRIKCRSKDGTKNIIIDPKTRINITLSDYPTPKTPSQFIIGVRKFMKGRRIEKIYQYNMDRIIVFQLRSQDEEPWLFIIEFFAKGNYILVDGDGLVRVAQRYKKYRDRDVLPKREYKFPLSSGTELSDLTLEKVTEIIQSTKGELVRILARSLNLSGFIMEEILLRLNIEKKQDTEGVSEENTVKIYEELKRFDDTLKIKPECAYLLYNKENQCVGFTPLEYHKYKDYKKEKRGTFNEVVDEFFSKIESLHISSSDTKQVDRNLSKYQKIIDKQQESIINLTAKQKVNNEKGGLIYENIVAVDNLISTIIEQKKNKGLDWDTISERINKGKEMNIPACLIFDKIIGNQIKVKVILNSKKVMLDLYKNASDNAQDYYKIARKSKHKIEGAKVALLDSQKKMEVIREKNIAAHEVSAVLLRSPKKKWYEKYRWFITTDGFLVVGGADASSNENIVKKHMNADDLFFHTDIHGASVCIIKNDEKKQIPESTIKETSVFAACYSSAWKKGWGSAKIFHVTPDQVSKSPKSGEYLNKGSFIITGEKKYLEKPILEMGIGLDMVVVYEGEEEENQNEGDGEETQYYPKIISAPRHAIDKLSQCHILIQPTKEKAKTSDLAKKIMGILTYKIGEFDKKYKRWAKYINLDEIIRKIPAGAGVIKK